MSETHKERMIMIIIMIIDEHDKLIGMIKPSLIKENDFLS